MRKLYTFLMAAAVALSASAIVRQKAVMPPVPLSVSVEQTSPLALKATAPTDVKAAAFNSIADVAGEYSWSYWGLLSNDSGDREGIVTIKVLNEETGEIQIDGIFSAGTGITGTIKGVVDLEAGTLTIANKQDLGPDSYGDNNWFYLKEIVDDELADGASDASNVVATLEGSTFTFPEDCIFAIGDFNDEELGWWKLTMENVFVFDDGGDDEDDSAWVDFTTATMYDGWIVPALKYSDGTYAEPEDFPLEVMVKRNVENPNIIKIMNPYMEDSGFPLSGGTSGAIIIDVTDPEFVLVMPGVFSGYTNGTNKVNCFNVEGFWVAQGYTKEVIIAAFDEIEEWSNMTVDEGITTIYIPTCRFNYPTASDKAYVWSDRGDAMKATIKINGSLSGIEEVNISNDENASVEYFNIQGVRVDKPQPGTVVIRRQGSKVSKMIVR